MKKTASFNLEKDILDIIENYKSEKDFSSRSTALERIILEWSYGVNKEKQRERIEVNNELAMTKNETEPTIIDSSLDESFDNMPE